MESLGKILKKLREEKKLPLRVVAAALEIDQAILSKIENDKRKATKPLIKKLAAYYQVDEDELLVAFLSDKLAYDLSDEKLAFKILEVAEAKVAYGLDVKLKDVGTTDIIKDFFRKDSRVAKAYVYGSFARNEDRLDSDVDVLIEFNTAREYSIFDIIDISYQLGELTGREIDLAEVGTIKDFAIKSVQKDIIKIYG